jgi:hypothetical protein
MPPFLRVLHSVFLQSLYIYFINRNHVLFYFSISVNIYVYCIVISLLSFCSKHNTNQWYQSMFLLIVFQCMSLTRSILMTIALACQRNPPWWKKIKTTEYNILLTFCLSKLSCDKGTKCWRFFSTMFIAFQ